MTASKAIILLGESGIGKDHLFKSLSTTYPNIQNVKFTTYAKTLVSRAFNVSPSLMDDKEWRTQNLPGIELSPLDLLLTLYHGARNYPKFSDANIKYTLDSIVDGFIPVFTDVRRVKEANAIKEAFDEVHWFRLYCHGVDAKEADGDLGIIVPGSATYIKMSRIEDEKELREFLALTSHMIGCKTGLEVDPRPKLNVVTSRWQSVAAWQEFIKGVRVAQREYQPFRDALDMLQLSVATTLGKEDCEDQSEINYHTTKLLENLLDDGVSVPMGEPENGNTLVFTEALKPYLPKLRQMASLQLWVYSEQATVDHLCFEDYGFTKEERDNARLYT